jgi:restriction endonuclease S subunit
MIAFNIFKSQYNYFIFSSIISIGHKGSAFTEFSYKKIIDLLIDIPPSLLSNNTQFNDTP